MTRNETQSGQSMCSQYIQVTSSRRYIILDKFTGQGFSECSLTPTQSNDALYSSQVFGLKGDILIAVNGESVQDLSPKEVLDLIKLGSKYVTLSIWRKESTLAIAKSAKPAKRLDRDCFQYFFGNDSEVLEIQADFLEIDKLCRHQNAMEDYGCYICMGLGVTSSAHDSKYYIRKEADGTCGQKENDILTAVIRFPIQCISLDDFIELIKGCSKYIHFSIWKEVSIPIKKEFAMPDVFLMSAVELRTRLSHAKWNSKKYCMKSKRISFKTKCMIFQGL